MYDSLRVFFVDSKKKFTELYIDIVSEWVYIIRADTVSECRPRGARITYRFDQANSEPGRDSDEIDMLAEAPCERGVEDCLQERCGSE